MKIGKYHAPVISKLNLTKTPSQPRYFKPTNRVYHGQTLLLVALKFKFQI